MGCVSEHTMRRIAALIERAPGIRTAEIAARTGMQIGAVRRVVHTLVEDGRISLCPRIDDEGRTPGDSGYDPGWRSGREE